MITFSKFTEATIELGKRFLKVSQFGTKTAKESYPFGFDSSPIANMTAIYSDTSNAGEAVIIGYINKNQVAGPGESRIFSVDGAGVVQAYIFAKSNGNLELNGSENSIAMWDPLDQDLQAQKIAINAELQKISAAVGLLGGSYIVSPINTTFEAAKSQKVKIT